MKKLDVINVSITSLYILSAFMLSGGVRNLAGIIQFGQSFDSTEMLGEISLVMKLVVFLVYAVVFCATAHIAGKHGARKRERDREALSVKEARSEKDESFSGFKL